MKLFYLLFFLPMFSSGQDTLAWQNVDNRYQPLPSSVHVFYTDNRMDTAPFKAYYLIASLDDRDLLFTTDTSKNRRLTPSGFYEKNGNPLVVVNGTFFSFETNQNLNLVVRNKKLLAFNRQDLPGRGNDTLLFRHVFPSALGIDKKRRPDIAWTFTDSSRSQAFALQEKFPVQKDSVSNYSLKTTKKKLDISKKGSLKKWKMETAIGGGPVLVQNGQIDIANNEEMKFAGKGIDDKHPRTAMGYTADHKLVILVVEGRNISAAGATLKQLARIMVELGCVEAINLDGGGSSCLLINGKETIRPSDREGQRAVPAVFMILNN
jgi:hypothetical protein